MQKDEPHVGFQSFDFGPMSDISVGKYEIHLGESVLRQSYYFLHFCVASAVWSYCEAPVFKRCQLVLFFPLRRIGSHQQHLGDV